MRNNSDEDAKLDWIITIFLITSIFCGIILSSVLFRVWTVGFPVRHTNDPTENTTGVEPGLEIDPGIRQNLPAGL